MPRDELEAAYFALLRAREELAGLRRYEDYLRDERARLRRFDQEGAALAETVEPRFRRVLAHTDPLLAEALRARVAVIEEELLRLPERLAGAEEFVADSEREHHQLRGST